MNPVISPERFFASEDIINNYQGLTCWILYSDMHKTLWKFIRENWHAFDEMSGSMGIKYDDMPAFVFFSSVRSQEKVLVKIDKHSSEDDLTEVFSQLMDCVRNVVQESRFCSEQTYEISGAIHEREQCLLRLQPEINRRRITSVLKRIVTPTSVIGAAQIAAAL